ncbi:MAG: metallophosphoesterase [Elusimicrobia bacterium]|nr:metallophosphoesterase [Elusimicrobiota bacterium]
MGRIILTAFAGLGLLAARVCAQPQAGEDAPQWTFAVISDIHVYTNGTLTPAFKPLVEHLAALRPRFVIMAGDLTSGNEDDDFGLDDVRGWWSALKESLQPLSRAGIPVLPMPGNHDQYRAVHRQGYQEAWAKLREETPSLILDGEPPLYYSFDSGGAHFTLMNVVSRDVDPAMEEWALEDIARASGRLKLGFGHVPLISVLGRTDADFRDGFGARLARAGLDAYVSGHEHLVWDEKLSYGLRVLRQLIIGTATATYTYPLSRQAYRQHCDKATCRMPYARQAFSLEPGTRQQARKQTFLLVGVSSSGCSMRMMAVDARGALTPFYE